MSVLHNLTNTTGNPGNNLNDVIGRIRTLGDSIGYDIINRKPIDMDWNEYYQMIINEINNYEPTEVSVHYWRIHDPYIAKLIELIGDTDPRLVQLAGQAVRSNAHETFVANILEEYLLMVALEPGDITVFSYKEQAVPIIFDYLQIKEKFNPVSFQAWIENAPINIKDRILAGLLVLYLHDPEQWKEYICRLFNEVKCNIDDLLRHNPHIQHVYNIILYSSTHSVFNDLDYQGALDFIKSVLFRL